MRSSAVAVGVEMNPASASCLSVAEVQTYQLTERADGTVCGHQSPNVFSRNAVFLDELGRESNVS